MDFASVHLAYYSVLLPTLMSVSHSIPHFMIPICCFWIFSHELHIVTRIWRLFQCSTASLPREILNWRELVVTWMICGMLIFVYLVTAYHVKYNKRKSSQISEVQGKWRPLLGLIFCQIGSRGKNGVGGRGTTAFLPFSLKKVVPGVGEIDQWKFTPVYI